MHLEYRYYRGDKEEIIKKLKEILDKAEKVLLAIAFGSFTRLDSYRDIDIAIYSLDESLEYLSRLGAKIEFELKIPVDVVPLSEIDSKFKWKILTKGLLIIEKKPGLYEALLSQTIDELELLRKTRSHGREK